MNASKYFFFTLLILSSLSGFSQSDLPQIQTQEIHTLFSSSTKPKGYGAFEMTMTTMNGRNTLLTGGQGGLIFEKKFALGFGGSGIASSNTFAGIDPQQEIQLVGGYGGLHLGYFIQPNNLFHIQIPLFLGIGGLQLINPEYTFDPNNPFNSDVIDRTIFYMIQPGIGVETNVTRFFRLGINANYRLTNGAEFSKNQITDADISGLAFNMTFKLGLF